MGTFRITIVGCGYIAQAEHIPAWLTRPGASICAVVDPRHDVATGVGERLGVPAFTTLAESLAAVPTVAVHICAPPTAHEELIRQAAAAGVHVLVEKPLALTRADAQACLDHARAAGTTIMVCAPRHYDADFGWVAAMLRDGQLGRVHSIESFWSAGLPPVYPPIVAAPRGVHDAYRVGGASALGMRMLEESVHHLSVIRDWLGGQVSVVSVRQSGPVWQVALAGVDGELALHTNATPLTHSEYIRVLGSEACAVTSPWAPHFPWAFGRTEIRLRSGSVETPAIARVNPFAAQIDNFIDVVEDRAPPVRAAADSVQDIALIEAVLARQANDPASAMT